LTLRPENTAPVARAYIQHQMHRGSAVERLYYIGPMFRYERPQKGRTRQFHQIGVEAIGSEHPAIDAETLQMLMLFLDRLAIRPLVLHLGSAGCESCRPAYRQVLLAELTPQRDALCADCHRRLETNPLRCLDCKVPEDQARMARVSPILDHLCADCRGHFDAVRAHLDRLEVPHVVAPRLVRGLDYYRRTTFEVTQPSLGAQSALLGGGRYDGLVKSLGGPAVAGFGFAVGEDRLVLCLPADLPGIEDRPDVYVAPLGEPAIAPALASASRLRTSGTRVVLDPLPDRSLKAQLRRAHDLQARFVLILGDEEVRGGTLTLKRMADGAQRSVPVRDLLTALQEMSRG
jgi:histidyl-tRNA synthetase